ncbi:MAG TPA: hypothetical protein VG992_04685 [Candidatus Saccharimonadales bacterium]|nr:hypothetical protein [Candidatus Saccharimonadales bacterium]
MKNKRFLAVAALLVASFLMPALAGATALNQAGLRLGRLVVSAGSGGANDGNDLLVTVKFNTTPTSVGKVVVTFPSSFTLTTGTVTPTTSGFPATPGSITALPGTLSAAVSNTTHTITVTGMTSASLTNSTLYGFDIPAGSITNPSSAGQYNTTLASQTAGGGALDSSTAPVSIVDGSTQYDQVVVHASVAPNFSFSLTGNSDTVPTVDPSAAQTSSGVTMNVSTNSPLGYTAYVKSANGGLVSATASHTISSGTFDATPDDQSGSTSDYTFVPTSGTLCLTSCNGSVAYDGEYAGLTAGPGGTSGGAFNGTNFASFVSRSGYTGGDGFVLQERVSVDATVPYANDYTDTLTVVAAGNF